jgi:YHS domain-containing protein
MHLRLILPAAAVVLAIGVVPFAARAQAPEKAPEKGKCVVSGKEIEIGEKTPRVLVQGKPRYFCCENCPKAFAKNPEQYLKDVGNCPVLGQPVTNAAAERRLAVNNGLWYTCCPGCMDTLNGSPVALKELTDVVSGKKFKPSELSPRAEYKEQAYYFASEETKAAFEKEPAKYAVVYAK